MQGKAKDRDVNHLRQAVHSFGFTVVARGIRVFVVPPDGEEIFVCRKLQRQGFWELNRVDRNLWELYGAVGISVFEYISIQELIKWFYDMALEIPEIMDGQRLKAKECGALATNADMLRLRGRARDHKHERKLARKRKRDKALQEAEANARKRQERIRDRINAAPATGSRRVS